MADSREDRLAAIARRVSMERGEVYAVEVAGDEVPELVNRLRSAFADEVDVRVVLGTACTTAIRAVEQIVAALQLPYPATRGWADLLAHLDDRPAALRRCVVVADAAELLKHEDLDRWRELIARLHSEPDGLGGGFGTLVLADHELMWAQSTFDAAAGAQEAAGRGR
jgi:hypothetical protein